MKIIGTITHYLWGLFETGWGFLQTLLGFMLIRFYYAIPVYFIWTFVVAKFMVVPEISYIAWWAILIAFDCIRFDITKLYSPQNYEKEENN